jgi:hypothetical protein
MEHLKDHHLEEIFPKQPTNYMHKINVNKDVFEGIQKTIGQDTVNIAINAFDPVYDTEFSLQYDIVYCLDKIDAAVDKPVHIYILGVVHPSKADMVERTVSDALEPFNFTLHNFAGQTLTHQMAVMLKMDLLLSGPYSLGFLAYTAHAPSFVIYPFNLGYLKGKTTDPKRTTDWYIETTDEDVFGDVKKAVELIMKE